MQFSSCHRRASVPTAVTAGRLGCPAGASQRKRRQWDRRYPFSTPQLKVSTLRLASSWSQFQLRMGRGGEFNKLLYNQTPDPVMLRSPPGVCHLPLPLPPCLSSTLFPSFPLGLSLSVPVTRGHSHPVAGECWISRAPASPWVRQGRAPLTRSLCLLSGRLPDA